jgi:hypothetical protein
MKKAIPIKTKKITQNNEGLATGLLDFGRDMASASKSSSNYKQQKERFAADFKAQWKDWWNRRKDIDLTQDSEAQAEQDKRDARNEKRREKRKTTPTTPTTVTPVAPVAPVAESKRFLNKSIMTESEYNRLNNLFESIVQIEEVSDSDAQYKALMMNNFLQQVYPAIWNEVGQPRNKAQYNSELMKWARSGFFSIGALDNFIEFLIPFNSKGFQAQAEKERSEPKDERSPYVNHTKAELDDAIENTTKKLKEISDMGSPEYKELYLILDALKHYKTTVRTL